MLTSCTKGSHLVALINTQYVEIDPLLTPSPLSLILHPIKSKRPILLSQINLFLDLEGIGMKCPQCQTENPDTKKFCRECGSKLSLACPKCESEVLPGDRFCGECGQNLTILSKTFPKDLSFGEKIDKIQRYLPKGLTEKILAQRGKIEGERKQVTVMFCDMEGFIHRKSLSG